MEEANHARRVQRGQAKQEFVQGSQVSVLALAWTEGSITTVYSGAVGKVLLFMFL